MKSKRLIIAGGRRYIPQTRDEQIITATVERLGVTEIISGGADGADEMGERYAKAMGIPLRVFPADWRRHGKKAGPMRNREMALQADACLLFPGGAGTADMRRAASEMGLEVVEAYPK